MSTTLELPENTSAVFRAPGAETLNFERTSDGGYLFRDVKVFRAGSFKDSRGRRGEWTREHLEALVSNFTRLRDRLPNVPVRVGHTRNPRDVMGYFEAMKTDGKFLFADFKVTEPGEGDKILRGTYRNRSFEVGLYEDNDGNRFWPVALGLAYVDLPAVEGLYSSQIGEANFTIMTPESDMAIENGNGSTGSTIDWQAAFYAQGLADAQAAIPPAGAPLSFTLGGATVSDPIAVQSYINSLETFKGESIKAGRKNFVESLATDKKILASQVENFIKHVEDLNDAQFEAFKGLYADAPVIPAVSQHGAPATHAGGTGEADRDPAAEEIKTLEDTVQFHRHSGMPEDAIKELPSFKKLAALKAEKK